MVHTRKSLLTFLATVFASLVFTAGGAATAAAACDPTDKDCFESGEGYTTQAVTTSKLLRLKRSVSKVDDAVHTVSSTSFIDIPGASYAVRWKRGKRGFHVVLSGSCAADEVPQTTEPDVQVRVMLDGTTPLDPPIAVMCEDFVADDSSRPTVGASVQFVSQAIPKGPHTLQAQWRVSDPNTTGWLTGFNFTVRLHKAK